MTSYDTVVLTRRCRRTAASVALRAPSARPPLNGYIVGRTSGPAMSSRLCQRGSGGQAAGGSTTSRFSSPDSYRFLAYAAVLETRCDPASDVDITIFTTAVQGFGYLVAMAIANLFYSLGCWSEMRAMPRNVATYRRRVWGLGLAFSVALPFSIPIFVAITRCRPREPSNQPLQQPNASRVRSNVGRCRDAAGCARGSSGRDTIERDLRRSPLNGRSFGGRRPEQRNSK